MGMNKGNRLCGRYGIKKKVSRYFVKTARLKRKMEYFLEVTLKSAQNNYLDKVSCQQKRKTAGTIVESHEKRLAINIHKKLS